MAGLFSAEIPMTQVATTQHPPQLPPLQRDALREALAAPSHRLVRVANGYIASHHARTTTSGKKTVRLFTGRLINMLWRDGLVDFDQAPWPNTVTLTPHGLAIAQQLHDAEQAKAGAAMSRTTAVSQLTACRICKQPLTRGRPFSGVSPSIAWDLTARPCAP